MQVLLSGIRTINSLEGLSRKLLDKHKAKNQTINNKIRKYGHDLTDQFDEVANDFYEDAVKEIVEFFGSSYDDDTITGCVFEYGRGSN